MVDDGGGFQLFFKCIYAQALILRWYKKIRKRKNISFLSSIVFRHTMLGRQLYDEQEEVAFGRHTQFTQATTMKIQINPET